jgi:hypothetical protein
MDKIDYFDWRHIMSPVFLVLHYTYFTVMNPLLGDIGYVIGYVNGYVNVLNVSAYALNAAAAIGLQP